MIKKRLNNKFLFSLLKGDFLMNTNSKKSLPFFLFIVFLLLINISISFNAVKLVKSIAKLEKEIYDLRLIYITTKSDLMYLHQRSIIEEKVASLGLKTPINPPTIIEEKIKK